MATLGTAGKKNAERTRLRPKNFRFRVSASGMAVTVTRMVVETA
ncbi:hypothetical protein [Arthrobacter sp. SD76]